MNKTSIEWTDATWNPVVGCTRASEGCDHCYAATMTRRLGAMRHADYAGLTTPKHFNGTVRCLEHKLDLPLRWKKPRMVFVNSMSDLFHEGVPLEFIDKVFAVLAFCSRHRFQVLTKRPARMASYFASRTQSSKYFESAGAELGLGLRYMGISLVPFPLPNVWLGTSIETQQTADERIPHLLRCPAAARFISQEPQLSRVVYRDEWAGGLHQVIVGGESGPGARPFDIQWFRETLEWCRRHSIAFFGKQVGSHVIDHNSTSATTFVESKCWPIGFKQDGQRIILRDKKGGDMEEWPEDLRVREFPAAQFVEATQ